MQTIELHGAKVPVIGLGTWDLRGEEGYQAVLSALSLGYRHIDTAEFYENEREVGRAIKDSGLPRDAIFLTTKVWYTHLRFQDLIRSCEASLQRLGTDYVDLYLIHWPNEAVPLEESLEAMEKLRAEGKIRFIGVSNFDTHLLDKARTIARSPILTDQVEYHPYFSQGPLLEYCQNNRIILTAYSPLARGRLLQDPLLVQIAEKYGKTVAQVVLRWLIEQDMVVAIPKAKNPKRQKENLDIFDFSLTEEEKRAISRLDRGQKVATRL
ncbi:MAG: aldo/keto reductase [Candidatus Caldatribacterium sp.]|uniref:aldo/keto reductase n=1 Tax=Candidatus Caldatribacterium sp. TaxID=2282143 RepID=UPI00299314B1|nr:aldo/keto reductase [Candidatus Caldatribacterium sp.]MCX7730301.1 aldo/keto reductase [Candidatus Caldatribacterium sp.]MDW8080361.1 aldo/keto reductase [Candidatus Calescibacterium sp.]